MNKPITLCDRCKEAARCCLNYDGGCCRMSRTVEPTNADRIRSLTDEELAAFFAQQKYRKPVFDGWLPLCNYVMGPRMCHEDGCEKCWLDWLKQEESNENQSD